MKGSSKLLIWRDLGGFCHSGPGATLNHPNLMPGCATQRCIGKVHALVPPLPYLCGRKALLNGELCVAVWQRQRLVMFKAASRSHEVEQRAHNYSLLRQVLRHVFLHGGFWKAGSGIKIWSCESRVSGWYSVQNAGSLLDGFQGSSCESASVLTACF